MEGQIIHPWFVAIISFCSALEGSSTRLAKERNNATRRFLWLENLHGECASLGMIDLEDRRLACNLFFRGRRVERVGLSLLETTDSGCRILLFQVTCDHVLVLLIE
jgi:hypothetical protein